MDMRYPFYTIKRVRFIKLGIGTKCLKPDIWNA